MKKELLIKLFEFIKNKRKYKIPFRFLLLNYPEHIESDDLYVNGDLDLIDTNIMELPDGLFISGNLILTDCVDFFDLGDNMTVTSHVYLTNTNISYLPKNLKCGTLVLRGVDIRVLPDDLVVTNKRIYVDYHVQRYFTEKYGHKFKFS